MLTYLSGSWKCGTVNLGSGDGHQGGEGDKDRHEDGHQGGGEDDKDRPAEAVNGSDYLCGKSDIERLESISDNLRGYKSDGSRVKSAV